jgi:hypothetical protein
VTDDARLDARVRSVLTDLPVPDDADTRAALVTVLQRSGGRRTDRGPWVVPTAAAAAMVAIAALAAFLGRSQPEPPAPAEPASVVGSWERQVSGAQLPGWDGGWRMTLSADGFHTLAGPPTATDSSEGASYVDSGGRLRVDAFVNSACAELPAGVYAWNRDARGLTLTLVADACDARPDLFAGRWLPAP